MAEQTIEERLSRLEREVADLLAALKVRLKRDGAPAETLVRVTDMHKEAKGRANDNG